jgi:surface protein
MDILEDSNIRQVLQNKTRLVPKILDIITNYTKTVITVEYKDESIIIATQEEFNNLDKKSYEKMELIEIYGVLILNNPIALFKNSGIIFIKGNVKLIGITKDMFYDAIEFIGDITNWDTSRVTDMSSMFYNTKNFNQELKWDTSSVTDMNCMFFNLRRFNKELKWDTSNVTDMNRMFNYAKKFNKELKWDTSKVTAMNSMFYGAESFNKELKWDTSKVTDMSRMFQNAKKFNQELKWDTSNVTDMGYMFNGAEVFNKELKWDTSNVTDMKHMFANAISFNKQLEWNTSKVTDTSGMFSKAKNFNQELKWDTSNVTNMSGMFSYATNFNHQLKFDKSSLKYDFKMFDKTLIEKMLLGHKTQMIEWFNSLDTKIKESLTISCKWYSFRFDGYLNSIYRNTLYPYNKLKIHIDTVSRFTQILNSNNLDTPLENKMCNDKAIVQDPFKDYIVRNKISISDYVEKVKDVTLYIHNTLKEHFYTLTYSVTVYRGIVVRENDNISLNITGVTSVTLDLKIAIKFLVPVNQTDKCYLLEFDLPVGTKIVPMDVCSFYDEKEYLVIDQGVLNILNQKIYSKKVAYNSKELPIVYVNAEFTPNDELPIYRSFNCDVP